MRELQLVKWCDVCWLDNQDDPDVQPVPAAVSWTVGIVEGDNGRPPPKVLDLCEGHAKPLSDLALLMSHIHQVADAPVPIAKGKPKYPSQSEYAQRPTPCPVCDQDVKHSALVAHIWSVHRTGPRPATPDICPECGISASGPGMTSHRRSTHGYDAVADALSGVKGYRPPKVIKAKAVKAAASQPELEMAAEA